MKYFLLNLFLFCSCFLAACGARGSQENPAPGDSSSSSTPASSRRSLPKIVAFGDSLTAGYGLSVNESYPSLLQKRLDADGYKYEVVNAGVSGDTTAGGLRRIDWALEGDVKIVILELGANDILRFQPIGAMKQNLAQIIERAKAKRAKVLLAGMIAPTNFSPDYRKATEEAFTDLAREYQVPLIPFFLDRVAGIETLNLPDGSHPNAEGTKIVTETVYNYLRPILEEKD
jgi:acyl-CoA thioesterase I